MSTLTLGLLLVYNLSCAPKPIPIDHPESECYRLLEGILEIQDQRVVNNDIMSETTQMYSRKEITIEEHKALFAKWHDSEHMMYRKVTDMYDKAYENNCFEQIPIVNPITDWRGE